MGGKLVCSSTLASAYNIRSASNKVTNWLCKQAIIKTYLERIPLTIACSAVKSPVLPTAVFAFSFVYLKNYLRLYRDVCSDGVYRMQVLDLLGPVSDRSVDQVMPCGLPPDFVQGRLR